MADAAEVGRKAASLGELLLANILVPDGVVLMVGAANITADDRRSLLGAAAGDIGTARSRSGERDRRERGRALCCRHLRVGAGHVSLRPPSGDRSMHHVPGGIVRSTTRIAAISTILFALAGIVWFVIESTPQRLGFEDTDDPAIMVGFIRQYPEVFVQAGTMLVLMAISLTIAVLAVAEVVRPQSDAVGLQSTSAFGLFSAAFFLFGGAVRIGSSGPLLHIAGLREEWGEGAYVAAQVASQALLIGGIFALCLWVVGLSLTRLRSKIIPLALCVFGVLPAFRIVSGLLGPLGLLPDAGVVWVISIASIFGTILWCLILGIVLLRWSFGSMAEPAVEPATACA